MEIILPLLIAITVITSILGFGYSVNNTEITVIDRLKKYTQETENSNNLPPELNRSFRDRMFLIISQFFGQISKRVSQTKKEAYKKKLMEAGNPYNLNAETFLILKYIVLFLCVLLGILSRNLLFLVIFSIMGFIIPDLFLKSNEKKRKDLILKSLPNVLDLLSVSMEAGLGFDSALQKVIEKYSGPLSEEFEKTIQEINIGRPRREALREMAERVDVDDVTIFLGSIIQAEQLGISTTNVLRLQSKQVRENRRMRADEKAQKAPVKILIPLVLFIFPTILIVLLGPAAIQILDTFMK